MNPTIAVCCSGVTVPDSPPGLGVGIEFAKLKISAMNGSGVVDAGGIVSEPDCGVKGVCVGVPDPVSAGGPLREVAGGSMTADFVGALGLEMLDGAATTGTLETGVVPEEPWTIDAGSLDVLERGTGKTTTVAMMVLEAGIELVSETCAVLAM
jgi:hypothetical protein